LSGRIRNRCSEPRKNGDSVTIYPAKNPQPVEETRWNYYDLLRKTRQSSQCAKQHWPQNAPGKSRTSKLEVDVRPKRELEPVLFSELVTASWQLRRIVRMETELRSATSPIRHSSTMKSSRRSSIAWAAITPASSAPVERPLTQSNNCDILSAEP
jgi:hypothetical protein